MNGDRYVRALRFRGLTRFYDVLIGAFLKEDRFRRLLVEQADLRPGHAVVDVGCGTGTLAVLVKRSHPEVRVAGLDGDPEILRLAAAKARAAGVVIELVHGAAQAPPFPPSSFDRVFSTLVFHHLLPRDKEAALAASLALLRPGGELHIADWGEPQNVAMRVAFLAVQLFDGFATTSDNVRGRLVPMIRAAGFIDVEETHREMTVFGTLSLYRARKPGAQRNEVQP